MNEQDWADRFSHDVDTLLSEAGRSDDEPTPAAYRQALDLARILATVDLSNESKRRVTLRRQLLSRVSEQDRKRRGALRWRPVLTVSALALSALLLIAAAWPDVLARFVQSLHIGPHTSVHQVDLGNLPLASPQQSTPLAPEVMQHDGSWTIHTTIGNFGGSAPPDVAMTVVRVGSFDQALAHVSFDLRRPEHLPAGYQLREAMIAPNESSFFFYDGPQGEIVLMQTPVYERVEKGFGGVAIGTSVVVGILTDNPLEEVVRDNWHAGWFEGNSLVWEADGISYILGGLDLSLEEAIRIAESLG
jgi:hypothetical protein